jgi:hypothetical protein
MDPTIIIYGIRALLRIAREGQAAYAQFVTDRETLFPSGLRAPTTRMAFVLEVFSRPQHLAEVGDGGAYAKYFLGTEINPDVPGALEIVVMRAAQLDAEDQAATGGRSRRIEIGGAVLIKQWADDKAPVGPVARLAVTLADVALEFVGANPSLLGIGGNGEKLIGAIASDLAAMIPDDAAQLGPQSQLAEHFVGIFLRAGLRALDEQTNAIVREEHLRALVHNTLPPLIAALPKDFTTDLQAQSQWRTVADALLGPAASAAMSTVAANPAAFFGSRFDGTRAAGALTQALLQQASETGLKQQFTEVGFIGLYKAALGIVAERPQLFLGRVNTPAERLAADLFRNVATTLKDAPMPFNGDVGAELAVAALEALQANGDQFIDRTRPWESVVGSMVTEVVNGLKDALAAPGTGSLATLFSPRQIVDLGRIFLRQAASTPGMIAPGRTELQAIVRAVAGAMAADEGLLLTPDDWMAIAGAAMEEAVANPGHLFPIDDTSPGGALAVQLIKGLLGTAASELKKGRSNGTVLFGNALREAIIQTLQIVSGNVKAATTNQAALISLAEQLSALVSAQPSKYGSKEWLIVYRSLLARALKGSPVGTLTEAVIDNILAGGTVA